jgi:D-aminoacyl-tRNA deacylase
MPIMRVVLQKTTGAKLISSERVAAEIGSGYVLYIGFENSDDTEKIRWMVKKALSIRLYSGWSKSIVTKGYEILLLPQPTLLSEPSGNRPSFSKAVCRETAERLFKETIECFKAQYDKVSHGAFSSKCSLEMINNGPFTAILEKH